MPAFSAVVGSSLKAAVFSQAELHVFGRGWLDGCCNQPSCGAARWRCAVCLVGSVLVWILVCSRLQATTQALTLARSARQLLPPQRVNGSPSSLAQVLLAGTRESDPSWHGTALSTLFSVCLGLLLHARLALLRHACRQPPPVVSVLHAQRHAPGLCAVLLQTCMCEGFCLC